MSDHNYIPNAGQTYFPCKDNINVPLLPFTPLAPPCPLYDAPVLRPEFAEKGIRMTGWRQHFLPGVTPEMLDWFWANMEKGYYLWAPGSHKRFSWVRSPAEYGFLNSAHMISETVAPGVPVLGGDGILIQRMDLSNFPFENALEHVIMEGLFTDSGELFDSSIHMWEAAPGGSNHIATGIVNTQARDIPAFVKAAGETKKAAKMAGDPKAHPEYEASQWPVFLPTLYRLWENHPDPCQNVPCDLRVRRTADGKFEYIAENGPIRI